MQELNRKNTELDRFAYTVSLDMKSPLITINGFLRYLEADMLTNDPERVQSDIQHISSAAGKMDRLISTLL